MKLYHIYGHKSINRDSEFFMQSYVTEPERRIPVIANTDVVVVGAGPAGFCAAIAAARSGVDTILIEQYGFAGGALTVNGIIGIGGWQHDLDGQPLIAGIPQEIMTRLADMGAANKDVVRNTFRNIGKAPDYKNFGGLGCIYISVNPELYKFLADDMLEAAGVTVMYHTLVVSSLIDDNKITGVIVEGKSGRGAICAKTVIDCTGDGDVAARSGAEYELGSDNNKICQPHSMLFTIANDGDIYLCYDQGAAETNIPEMRRGRYKKAVADAREKGIIKYNPNDILCSTTVIDKAYPQVKTVNFTRVQQLDATDTEDLTKAEILGRKQVREGINFMRRYVENCEAASLIGIAPAVGVRESRRIIGDYILTGDDILHGARFDDVIARGIYLIDYHNPTEVGKPSILHKLEQPYDIPYRCLVPKGLQNLLVAGRCISGDSEALSSYRIQSHCMAMGEAAGRAAALAVKSGVTVRDIDIKKLQSNLKESGANIGR